MKKLLLASAAFIAMGMSVPASAADMPVKAVYKAPPPVYFSWSGCYLGGDVGIGWGRDRDSEVVRATGATSPFNPPNEANLSGGKFGGYLGCNMQFAGAWVIGIEADGEFANLRGSTTFNTPAPQDNYEARIRSEGSLRGRFGYGFDRVLFYVTAGGAIANVRQFYAVGANPAINETFSNSRTGWTAGLGLEYAITNNLIGRVEYRYADFGTATNLPVVTFPNFTEQHRVTENVVRFGLSYKFGGWGKGVVAAY
jgi:outer membrane immunogenic protein